MSVKRAAYRGRVRTIIKKKDWREEKLRMRNDLVETGTTRKNDSPEVLALYDGMEWEKGERVKIEVEGQWFLARDQFMGTEEQMRRWLERNGYTPVDPPVPTKEEVEVPEGYEIVEGWGVKDVFDDWMWLDREDGIWYCDNYPDARTKMEAHASWWNGYWHADGKVARPIRKLKVEEVEVPQSSVETLTMPDIEKLLSDALMGEGNDSVWRYEDDRFETCIGTFEEYCHEEWNLPHANEGGCESSTREDWFKDLRKGTLTLVSPASVKASEPSDVQIQAPTTVQKEDLSPSSLVVWEGTIPERTFVTWSDIDGNNVYLISGRTYRIAEVTDQPIPDATREGEAS